MAVALAVLMVVAAPAVSAMPAQPVAQAAMRCASGIVPLNRRCRVVDFAQLGDFAGRTWYYAFYDTHWADRHGRQDRGFPVIFFLEKPATLRLSLWVDDAPGLAGRWALTPPVRPVVIEKPDAIYLGLTLEGLDGPDDQRLFRLEGKHWKIIELYERAPADQARLDAATPTGCGQTQGWAYDWGAFTLRAPLKTDLIGADCGTIVADLEIRHDKLSLANARLVR
jgi:hypothetical protein